MCESPCGRKEEKKDSDYPGTSLALSCLSPVFIDNLELTATDRFSSDCVLWNKLHYILFMILKAYSKWFPLSLLKRRPFHTIRQLREFERSNSLSFLYSEHFELKTFRKLGNLGSIVTIPKTLKSTVWQPLSSLSYQNGDLYWEVKNNYSHFFWKLKADFPSRNKESYFMSYISTALREFPWNYLGGGAGLVLSLAFKNRSGYQDWSTSTCLS